MPWDKIGEKQKMVKPYFLVPDFHLCTNSCNDPLLYLAPMVLR